MYADCDGRFIPERFVDYFEARRWHMAPYRALLDLEVRKGNLVRERKQKAQDREERAIAAGVAMLRCGALAELRAADPEAERLAHDHGITHERVAAYAGLAATRGVSVEAVIRAALAGELRSIVKLPPVRSAG